MGKQYYFNTKGNLWLFVVLVILVLLDSRPLFSPILVSSAVVSPLSILSGVVVGVFSIPHAWKSALKVQTHLGNSECTPHPELQTIHPNSDPTRIRIRRSSCSISDISSFTAAMFPYVYCIFPPSSSSLMTSKNGIHKHTWTAGEKGTGSAGSLIYPKRRSIHNWSDSQSVRHSGSVAVFPKKGPLYVTLVGSSVRNFWSLTTSSFQAIFAQQAFQ